MGLGGTTGYAINPARDLGPRIVYQLLPRKEKDADWSYSWIPIAGPIGGAIFWVIPQFFNIKICANLVLYKLPYKQDQANLDQGSFQESMLLPNGLTLY